MKKIIFALIFVFSLQDVLAAGISVAPTRVMFEGKNRKSEIIVNNSGDAPQRYRVELQRKRMLEDGRSVVVDEPREGELFADSMLRFSPRSFELKAGSSQKIRLHLRKPKGIKDGEYRSHLRVQIIPEAITPEVVESGEVSIGVQINYGVSVPVIIRHGELDFAIDIKDVKFKKNPQGKDEVETIFARTGKKSSYGDIAVYHVNEGSEELVKFMPGIAIYYPNNLRTFKMPLDVKDGKKISGGKLRVVYRDQKTSDLIAQKEISL